MNGLTFQVIGVLVTSLGFTNIGTTLQFPSTIIADVETYNATIFGTFISLTDSQKDMIGSFVGLGAMVGAVVISLISNIWGRRKIMINLAIGAVISWIGTALCPSVIGIIAFRFILGFLITSQSIVGSSYIVETSETRTRGIFCGLLAFYIICGQVYSAVLSYWLRYFYVALLNGCLSLLFLVGLLFLPESPGYLVVKGKETKAAEVFKSLRTKDADIDSEMEAYRLLNKEREKQNIWRGLITLRAIRRISVIAVLFFIREFGGYDIMVSNAFRIFKTVGSDIDEKLASIIMFVSQVPSNLIFSFFLVDRIGRRKSLFLSYAVVSVTLFSLAANSYYEDIHRTNQTNHVITAIANETAATNRNFVPVDESERNNFQIFFPVIATSLCLTGFHFGLQTIPFLLTVEYFPTWIRSQAAAICNIFYNFFLFTTLQLYSPMDYLLGVPGFLLFRGLVVVAGIPFTYVFVKETMGKMVG